MYCLASNVPSSRERVTNQESPLGKSLGKLSFLSIEIVITTREPDKALSAPRVTEKTEPPASFSRCRVNVSQPGTECPALGPALHTALASASHRHVPPMAKEPKALLGVKSTWPRTRPSVARWLSPQIAAAPGHGRLRCGP